MHSSYAYANDGNRTLRGQHANAQCLGTGCMAWRWTETEMEQKRTYAKEGEAMTPPVGDGWQTDGVIEGSAKRGFYQDWHRVRPDRRGTCGIAGRLQANDHFDDDMPF